MYLLLLYLLYTQLNDTDRMENIHSACVCQGQMPNCSEEVTKQGYSGSMPFKAVLLQGCFYAGILTWVAESVSDTLDLSYLFAVKEAFRTFFLK